MKKHKTKLEKNKERIVILGGGFGGVYTAMHLEKLLGKNSNYEIILVNKENYFVYQPMLAEVVGGSVGLIDTVSSLRALLPKTKLFVREIYGIDIPKKTITLSPQFSHSTYELTYDHLVFALGCVTDFRGIPGIHEHALPFKTLADAIIIRNRVIDVVESAACEENAELKAELLSFVIGGGGFSGVEVAAELNDFIRKLVKSYPEIDPKMVRVVLVHSQNRLMERELNESLSRYSEKILKKRGVEIRFGQHLTSASPNEAIIDGKEKIKAKTVISTVPSSPNPLLEKLPLPLERGKIKTDCCMLVNGYENIWAIGDCALIPLSTGQGFCPPTAQFAIREGATLAKNIVAKIEGKSLIPFNFKCLGMLGALGHHSAVAELFGTLKFSGFFAWLMWRAIYWMKLPGFDRKLKVVFSWLLDMIIPIESVQLKASPTHGIINLHYEKGDIIFNEGDVGDYLYIIASGEIEILKAKDNQFVRIATLSAGEYFGEMALLNEIRRMATVRCLTPVDVLALRKNDFGALISNLEELRKGFEKTNETRKDFFEKTVNHASDKNKIA
jgi:NADH dehydrogenase